MRIARASLLVWLALAAPAGVGAGTAAPPTIPARAWLLMDHDSGQVLAAHNADAAVAPASLTKLMTAYLIFERLQAGALKLDDTVTVSERAAAMKGATLFLRQDERASVEELIKGMIVRSANDATLALVEHVAGEESRFVEQMNAKAQLLDLNSSSFRNVTGLDAEGQRSNVQELTRLTSRLIRDFPELYARWFAIKEFSFNQIRQFNRNALLWRDTTVDGVKTGRTRDAGYSLIVSAKRERMRLIATVIGAADESGRVEGVQRLLDYGFRNYETRLLYAADAPAAKVRVWMGEDEVLPLGVERSLYLTLPRGWHERLQARLTVKDMQTAPILRGQRVGTLALDLEGKPYAEYPLVALKEIKTGNILQRALDRVQLWLQ